MSCEIIGSVASGYSLTILAHFADTNAAEKEVPLTISSRFGRSKLPGATRSTEWNPKFEYGASSPATVSCAAIDTRFGEPYPEGKCGKKSLLFV